MNSLLSYLRKLRNHEFAEAYELISVNLASVEMEEGNLCQAIDEVRGYVSKLVHLKNLKRQHPITEKLDALKKKRHQYFLSLRGRVAYCRKSPTKEEALAANRLHYWMLSYREFFKGATIHTQSRLSANLNDEVVIDPSIMEGVALLGLNATMDAIMEITSEMRLLHLVRLKEKKEEAALADSIRTVAFAHIVTLWKTLEVSVALKTHDGELCRGLFESINWVIIDFKAKYLGKNTRRENEKLKETEQDNTPVTD